MKTPDEIKKGLKYCWNMLDGCTGCPYERNDGECDGSMETDALAYIQQLENDLQYTTDAANIEVLKLESRLAQVERERDGMAAFIKSIDPLSFSIIPVACRCCKNHDGNFTKDKCAFCQTYGTNANWEWRGVCEENTHDQPSM